ncbi:hypothetical protein ABEB36_002103 [Hypothenemus hampei]|uniref:Uncharacterized protein n=1 Tax=Hypothenemus hampei TaxID=57062 RepID=A0ABD1F4J5_HYPHA
MKMTSIIPGLLLVTPFLLLLLTVQGHARNLWALSSDSALQPILSQSQRTRICYELCLSGLGGEPCGDSCYDLIPSNLPILSVSQNTSVVVVVTDDTLAKKYNSTIRDDSCKVLCKNGLGYPLCACSYNDTKTYPDFVEICSVFCVNYNYQLYGCQNCTLYVQYASDKSNPIFEFASMDLKDTVTVGWKAWCREMCSDGNGGAACNCDLLP